MYKKKIPPPKGLKRLTWAYWNAIFSVQKWALKKLLGLARLHWGKLGLKKAYRKHRDTLDPQRAPKLNDFLHAHWALTRVEQSSDKYNPQTTTLYWYMKIFFAILLKIVCFYFKDDIIIIGLRNSNTDSFWIQESH